MQFVVDNILAITTALLSGGMLLWTVFGNRIRGIRELDCIAATQLINHKNALVLDVREDSEYKSGHVLNALHIPLGKLAERLGELDKYKGRPVLTVCRSGQRSCIASVILAKNGFDQAYTLEGGMQSWQKAKLPTEK